MTGCDHDTDCGISMLGSDASQHPNSVHDMIEAGVAVDGVSVGSGERESDKIAHAFIRNFVELANAAINLRSNLHLLFHTRSACPQE